MHPALPVASLAIAAAAIGGCSSASKSTAASSRPAPAGACTMRSASGGVLRVATPPGADCTSADGFLQLRSRDGHVDIWLVKDASTIDDAAARAPQIIQDEFRNFVTSQTGSPAHALTVAGAPARRLAGNGVEADDGDPGAAELIIFRAGAGIFIACTHGEYLSAAAVAMLDAITQSAQPVER